MLNNYLPIVIFLAIACGLSVVMVFLPILVSMITGNFKPDKEKLSTYECGFDPVGGEIRKFDVRFYLVAILFVVFDLEIAFLFPWAISLKDIGFPGFWSMMVFLAVLAVGFIYEWRKGALDW